MLGRVAFDSRSHQFRPHILERVVFDITCRFQERKEERWWDHSGGNVVRVEDCLSLCRYRNSILPLSEIELIRQHFPRHTTGLAEEVFDQLRPRSEQRLSQP